MIKLTRCEMMTYKAMAKKDKAMALQEIAIIINEKYNVQWSKKAVKAFLARLIRKKCVTKNNRGLKQYYTITNLEISEEIAQECYEIEEDSLYCGM